MSTITISVGQCGNQLSNKLIDYLKCNRTAQSSFLFEHFDNKFHFVNLDSESKVISKLLNDHKHDLRLENLINTKCGRGSNWASGYSGLQKDGALKIIEQSLEAIRRESERCDFLLNFNIMHSLSGGTGSGCGSKLIEQLRDEFGWKKNIFTQSVAPFSDGELPLQHYNNLLCLSHLHEYADGIFLYQNDDIFSIVEKMMNSNDSKPSTYSKTASSTNKSNKLSNDHSSISIEEMNSYIINCLLSTIYPVDSISLKEQSIGMELFELQRFLCPNPNLKIIELYTLSSPSSPSSYARANETSNKLSQLLKQLFHYIPKRDLNEKLYVSLNSLFVSRGNQDLKEYNSQIIMSQMCQEFETIKKTLNPVPWNPFTIDFWSSKHSINQPGTAQIFSASKSQQLTTNSITIATNRNKCVNYLQDVLDKSLEKFQIKAYLHWYHKFNIMDDHFHDSFQSIQSIIESYDQMTK
jgi:hypothetical protein